MRLSFLIIFATFVVSNSYALPDDPVLDSSLAKPSAPATGTTQNKKDLSTINVSPNQDIPASDRKPEYFYSYSQSFSPRFGIGYYLQSPQDPPEDDQHFGYLFGMQYMMKSITHRHWEVGFDILSISKAYLHGGMKWVFDQTKKTRPYGKAGLALRFDRNDGMEAVVDYKSYAVRAAIGVETIAFHPASFRFDLELNAGIDDVSFLLAVGYSWPW